MTSKKSFILYTDQQEVVNSLTNEQAGKLLKAFFEYHTSNNVKLDNLLSLVFIPFKQTFTRDYEKWLKIANRNKENINKRWKSEAKTSVPHNTKNTTGKSGIPNTLVSVSDSVSVSVSDSVNKEHIVAHEVRPYIRKPLEKATQLQRVVYHLEDTLKTTIVNWGKQAKALSMMLKAGYTEEQIKKTITYMASRDEFFGDKGFDLTTVSNQISRYKAQSQRNGI